MDIVGSDIAVARRRAPDKAEFDAAPLVGKRSKHAAFSDTGETVSHPTKRASSDSCSGWPSHRSPIAHEQGHAPEAMAQP